VVKSQCLKATTLLDWISNRRCREAIRAAIAMHQPPAALPQIVVVAPSLICFT
jgi:hypothetical protein